MCVGKCDADIYIRWWCTIKHTHKRNSSIIQRVNRPTSEKHWFLAAVAVCKQEPASVLTHTGYITKAHNNSSFGCTAYYIIYQRQAQVIRQTAESFYVSCICAAFIRYIVNTGERKKKYFFFSLSIFNNSLVAYRLFVNI